MPTLAAPAPAPPARPGVPDARRRRRRVLLTGAGALALGTEAVLVAPHVGNAVAALMQAAPGWSGLAVLATAASLTAFALVRRCLLGAAGVRVSTASSLASILVSNAFHVTLPGGVAFSTAYSYRWMREHGAGATVAGWNLAVNGVLATACLAALGLVASLLTGGGTSGVRLVVAIAAGGVAAAPALSAVVLYRLVSLVGVVAAGRAVHGVALLGARPAGGPAVRQLAVGLR